jgi:hypothetical protein
MASWSCALDTAVMHDHHSASKRFPDGVSGFDVGRHVLVVGLGPLQRPIESIENHQGRRFFVKLPSNCRDDCAVVGNQVGARCDQVETGLVGIRDASFPECFRSCLEAIGAFKRT